MLVTLINEAIQAYQTDGNRAILDDIKTAMSYDYLSRGVRDLPDVNYIALRCLRLISGRLSTIKYGMPDTGGHAEDSPRSTFDYYVGVYNRLYSRDCTLENYAQHAPYLYRYYGDAYWDLWQAYKVLNGQAQSERAKAAAVIIAEHWSDIEEALVYALLHVDSARTPREIVRYINRVTKTAYVRQQFADKRRVRRGGKTRYVDKHFYTVDYAIFGIGTAKRGRLSRRQAALVESIDAVILADMASGFDLADYVTDLNGRIRIKVRYIARKLKLREDSLGRALRVMTKKVS
ncbi:hypothetical protein [Paenibacillus qinlingensis]|uniref:hypothetical protein n=1 Tax=Paenibacillus qinlingensis TaxID=1837343 RepID=UPI001563DED8|nr:hypothetical protein [Paenibacillus qinlingensis]NQX61824.1 hypothetical protein [Paenibacillus qinlingensis]